MKKFAIVGAFFQIQRGRKRQYGICGNTIYASLIKCSYDAGKLLGVPFVGMLSTDDNFGVFTGELNDQYGKASVVGVRKILEEENKEAINFDKTYNTQPENPVHYQLIKDGEFYYGHFTIEGAHDFCNGWVTCKLFEINNEFISINDFIKMIKVNVEQKPFLSSYFKEEIDTKIAEWNAAR
jgi:hypothetical protein